MSKLVFRTSQLQSMVSRIVKGAGNNQLIPITTMLEIKSVNNDLMFTTTDGSNTLQILEKGAGKGDFCVVIPVEVFSKLVAKMTTDSIQLELKESSLEVKGNGTYQIELPIQENGQLLEFPSLIPELDVQPIQTGLSILKSVLNSNSVSVAKTMEVPCYTGYYFSKDMVLTTDTIKICHNAVGVFNNPVLLPAQMIELFDVLNDDKISVYQLDNRVIFKTSDCIISGTVLDGITDYQIDAISGLLDTAFTSMVKVPKKAFISLIDRLSLFVTAYDSNTIALNFTEDGLMVSSKKSTGEELLKYQSQENFVPFACLLDMKILKDQLQVQSGETVEIWFGVENAVKMIDNKVTIIIATYSEES